MYNDEMLAGADAMEKMKEEYKKASGKFAPYVEKNEKIAPTVIAEDYLYAGYALSEIIEKCLLAQRRGGRYHKTCNNIAESLTNAFYLALFGDLSDETLVEYEKMLAKIDKIRREYLAIPCTSLSDYILFLLEQTDGLILLESGGSKYLTLGYLAMRLAFMIEGC